MIFRAFQQKSMPVAQHEWKFQPEFGNQIIQSGWTCSISWRNFKLKSKFYDFFWTAIVNY